MSYLCKACNSVFFHEAEVAAHKETTGHGQIEKKAKSVETKQREELYAKLEEIGIPTEGFDALSDAAVDELVRALKTATDVFKNEGKRSLKDPPRQ